MTNIAIAEDFKSSKKDEYLFFTGHLGTDVCFSKDRWVCDKLRRAPAEPDNVLTMRFNGIPEHFRDIVKYFFVISIIQGKAVSTVKSNIRDLIRFFNFWLSEMGTADLHMCDEIVVAKFCYHLDERELAESTKAGTWATVCTFFKTMRRWYGMQMKNPFSVSPYSSPRKFDDKYIPESVTIQLDRVFKNNEIPLYHRCAYWLLRLIPSRVSEIVGMRIDCLKRYNGNYVIFIPTWKQNGGWQEPIMRSIHLEETGIAGYLIDLVKQQQDMAHQLQKYMQAHQKDALFTYRKEGEYQGIHFYSEQYLVTTAVSIRIMIQNVCKKYNITDDGGQVFKVTTHQFRHNGITDRLAAGFTAAQIAEMTAHHGSAMILNSYNHLDLLPETIIEKQEYVLQEPNNHENRYVMFGGRILNMEEQLEKRLLKNLRAHKVRQAVEKAL